MFELKLETVGGRLVMTGLATVVWLATVSVRYGWSPMVALIGFLILLFVIPFTPRLNKVLPSPTALLPKPPRRITTTLLEFVLYGGFIGLVTYQSVGLAFQSGSSFWYHMPPALTIGIVPQIASRLNRVLSIVLSVLIYLAVLYTKTTHINDFIARDIHFYYAVVLVTAFSVQAANVVLHVVNFLAERVGNLLVWIIKVFLAGMKDLGKK